MLLLIWHKYHPYVSEYWISNNFFYFSLVFWLILLPSIKEYELDAPQILGMLARTMVSLCYKCCTHLFNFCLYLSDDMMYGRESRIIMDRSEANPTVQVQAFKVIIGLRLINLLLFIFLIHKTTIFNPRIFEILFLIFKNHDNT